MVKDEISKGSRKILEIEENLYFSLLLDMYSPLLTGRQLVVLSCYYNDNLGLSEIATLFDTTRQAVRDLLWRGKRLLSDYEAKLHLLSKMNRIKYALSDVCMSIENGESKENVVKELNSIMEIM